MKNWKNSLYDWSFFEGDIIGRARFAQPSAGVTAGELLKTSRVISIRLVDGKRIAETFNSLYTLED